MKVIVYTKPDDSVMVLWPSKRFVAECMAGVGRFSLPVFKPDGTYKKHPNGARVVVNVEAAAMPEEDVTTVLLAKDVPPGSRFVTVIEQEQLLQSRRFRDCWRWNGATYDVDMVLARTQRMTEIRAERDAKLDALDKEFMKALSTKQDTKAVVDKMQLLRDIPQSINLNSIQTAEELEAFQPEWPQ